MTRRRRSQINLIEARRNYRVSYQKSVSAGVKDASRCRRLEREPKLSIWKRNLDLQDIAERFAGTLPGHFGIRIKAIGADFIEAEMPVDERHIQPMGLLHGGASVVLSETLGSVATNLTLGPLQFAVGIEVNANHIASVRAGETVTAICRPLQVGGKVQVWQTEIRRADGKLACVSRLTTQVLDKR